MDDQIKLTPLNPDDVGLHSQYLWEIYSKRTAEEVIACEQAMDMFLSDFDTQKRFS